MGKGSGACDGRRAMTMPTRINGSPSFIIADLQHERCWGIIAGDHALEIWRQETGDQSYIIRTHRVAKSFGNSAKLPIMEYAYGDDDYPDTALSLLYGQEFRTIKELQQAVEQLTGLVANIGLSHSVWSAEEDDYSVAIYRQSPMKTQKKSTWVWEARYNNEGIAIASKYYIRRQDALIDANRAVHRHIANTSALQYDGGLA